MELVIRRMLSRSLFAARSISIVENDATSEPLKFTDILSIFAFASDYDEWVHVLALPGLCDADPTQ